MDDYLIGDVRTLGFSAAGACVAVGTGVFSAEPGIGDQQSLARFLRMLKSI